MKKLIIYISILVLLCFSSLINVNAKITQKYLDEINYYEIVIKPNSDGTLNMEIEIEWTVLDSKKEGPLEWIKVGIPNKYINNIKANCSSIKNIYYYSDNGSFIRIDLDRKYYAGETLEIKFSFVQTRMYILNNNECYYNYKPGWFTEIPVKKCVVKWYKDGVIDSNKMSESSSYYLWESSLQPKETIDINIKYNQSYFESLSKDLQYSDAYMTTADIVAIVIVIVVIVIVIVILAFSVYSQLDPYMYERGFVGRGYIYHRRRYYHSGYYSTGKKVEKPVIVNESSFSGHHGGGSCACACACACAGGGRAGCSMKDFYKHPNLEKIKKALK